MVYFIFGDRDIQCSYFPNDRVLSDLRKSIVRFNADTSGLSQALEYGKVNFGNSTINENDCNVYQLELESKNKIFFIENCDSSATLVTVSNL